MTSGAQRRMQVFISYAHEDDALRAKLVTHLAQLRHDGLIEEWHDRRLTGGQEWAGQIDAQMESADIVLLLVSPDFINSQYCYDKEMTRALERHDAGQARVIPVILRPTDWESAPFGKLQAFPKDATPVVKWEPLDDGFLEVARGLRKVVVDLTGAAPTKSDTGTTPPPRPTPRWLKVMVVAAILVVAAAAAAGWWWHHIRVLEAEQLSAAEAYMQRGRYSDAKAAYEQALKIKPGSDPARFGLIKAALSDLKGDWEKFSLELDTLLKQAPEDPDLLIFDGDRYYRRGEKGKAVERYERALSNRPKSAEAHFRLGVISDQAGDTKAALDHYQKAADLSRDTPMYRNNLAYVYYKQGEYDRAIEEYRQIEQYPLAALEWAKAAWMKGDLDEAREGQMVALNWLEDERIASMPKNQGSWYFEMGQDKILLVTLPEKVCYAKLALSATLFLQGREADSATCFKQAVERCANRDRPLKMVLEADLALVARAQPPFSGRIDAYRRRYLSN